MTPEPTTQLEPAASNTVTSAAPAAASRPRPRRAPSYRSRARVARPVLTPEAQAEQAAAFQARIGPSLDLLQGKLGVTINDSSLLLEAITHSSFAYESPHLSPRDNERLEFLGDSVLQLITGSFLFKYHPSAAEGELSQTRSSMANTFTLAHMSEQLDLGSFLLLGHAFTETSRPAGIKALLANVMEATIGAIFLDQGYDAAQNYFLTQFRALPAPTASAQMMTPARTARPTRAATSSRAPRSARQAKPAVAPAPTSPDYKASLAAFAAERGMATPTYDSEGAQIGSNREYLSVVFAGSDPLGTGFGASQVVAEQDAARVALGNLGAAVPALAVATAALAAAPVLPKPARAHRPRRRRRSGSGPKPTTPATTPSPAVE